MFHTQYLVWHPDGESGQVVTSYVAAEDKARQWLFDFGFEDQQAVEIYRLVSRVTADLNYHVETGDV